MTKPKKHHQVPQFLLRNFAFNRANQLHAFDKRTGRTFVVAVGDAAAQSGFYDFDVGGQQTSIEDLLARLETATASAVSRIVRAESLSVLSDEDRIWLGLFVSFQLFRSPNWRLMQRDLAEQIAKLQKDLRGESASEALPEGTELVPDDPLELFTILEARRWLPLIQEKTWVLLRSSNSSGLLISDSPLTLHNSREFGPYGNIGLGVPGIEIHLPLSSKLDLWMICPSLFAEFERGFKLAHSLRASGWSAAEIDAAISRVDRIRSGAPWDMTDDNVTHINHLQVVYSARFVYSEHGDFSLVERMLRDNASYRDGIRFKT